HPGGPLGEQLGRSLEAVALPGASLDRELRRGDVMVRRCDGKLANVSVIAEPKLRNLEGLLSEGLTPESFNAGNYAQVVETGARPHPTSDGFARQITNSADRLLNDILLLRLATPSPTVVTVQQPPSPTQELEREPAEAAGAFPVTEQAPAAAKPRDQCYQRWLKEITQYPIEVRNAIDNAPAAGWADVVTWARTKGIRDEATLRRLVYFAFWGPTHGYCEPSTQTARQDWARALQAVRTF